MVRGVGLVLIGMWGGIVGCSGVSREKRGWCAPVFLWWVASAVWGGVVAALRVVVIIVWV